MRSASCRGDRDRREPSSRSGADPHDFRALEARPKSSTEAYADPARGCVLFRHHSTIIHSTQRTADHPFSLGLEEYKDDTNSDVPTHYVHSRLPPIFFFSAFQIEQNQLPVLEMLRSDHAPGQSHLEGGLGLSAMGTITKEYGSH